MLCKALWQPPLLTSSSPARGQHRTYPQPPLNWWGNRALQSLLVETESQGTAWTTQTPNPWASGGAQLHLVPCKPGEPHTRTLRLPPARAHTQRAHTPELAQREAAAPTDQAGPPGSHWPFIRSLSCSYWDSTRSRLWDTAPLLILSDQIFTADAPCQWPVDPRSRGRTNLLPSCPRLLPPPLGAACFGSSLPRFLPIHSDPHEAARVSLQDYCHGDRGQLG